MKRIIIIGILSVFFLVGCSKEYVTYSGEGDQWKGEYVTTIDESSENGEYTFDFKDGTKIITFKKLEIFINDGETHLIEDNYKRATVKIPISCSGCSVTSEKSKIKVTIKWNNKNEETFFLENSR